MLHSFRILPLVVLLLLVDGAGAAELPVGEQIVVLRNGRVLRGAVTRELGYHVLSIAQGSQLHLADNEVDFVCLSLEEAYATKQARIRHGDAPRHVELSEWCLAQGLLSHSATQLVAVMEHDPRNPRIESIERRLQAAIKAQKRAANPPPPRVPAAAAQASFERADAGSFDRAALSLPPGAVESFARHVQPLLINRCAAHGCHGTGTRSSYVLLRPLHGAPPQRFTQQNLRATMSLIDPASPNESRLLLAASTPHGGADDNLLLGPRDARHYEALAAWVRFICGKSAPEPTAAPASFQQEGASPEREGAASMNGPPEAFTAMDAFRQRRDEQAILQGGKPAPTAPAGQTSRPPAPLPLPPQGAPAAPRDPFDPEAFNRAARPAPR